MQNRFQTLTTAGLLPIDLEKNDDSFISKSKKGIVETDLQGQIIYVNQHAKDILQVDQIPICFFDFLALHDFGSHSSSQKSSIYVDRDIKISYEIKVDEKGNELGYLFFLEKIENNHDKLAFDRLADIFGSCTEFTRIMEAVLTILMQETDCDEVVFNLKKSKDLNVYSMVKKPANNSFKSLALDNYYHPEYEMNECLCSLLQENDKKIARHTTEKGTFYSNDTQKDITNQTINFDKCCKFDEFGSVAIAPLKFHAYKGLVYFCFKEKRSITPYMLKKIENLTGEACRQIENFELKRQYAGLRDFLADYPHPVFEATSSGRLLEVNEAGRKILSVCDADIPDHLPKSWMRHLVRAVRENTKKDFETRVNDNFYHVFLLPSQTGQTVNGFALDITTNKKMQEYLNNYRSKLEYLIKKRTEQLNNINKKLLNEIQDREKDERELFEIKEREQSLFGKELHEQISQQFAGVAFLSKVLAKKLETSNPKEASSADKISELANEALLKARYLALGLVPVDVNASSLMENLDMLASNYQHIYNIELKFDFPTTIEMSDFCAVNLYSLIQDAINFNIKRFDSKNICIKLIKQNKRYILSIVGDGKSLKKEKGKSDLIIRLLNFRAGMINGNLKIHTGSGSGTNLVCSFPSIIKSSEEYYDKGKYIG